MDNAALADEVMIPIRLDIDLESFKIKDSFMWNMNGNIYFYTTDLFRRISDTRSICKHHVLRFGYPTTSLCASNFNSNTYTNRRIRPRGRNSDPRRNRNASRSQYTTPSSKTSPSRSIRMESLLDK